MLLQVSKVIPETEIARANTDYASLRRIAIMQIRADPNFVHSDLSPRDLLRGFQMKNARWMVAKTTRRLIGTIGVYPAKSDIPSETLIRKVLSVVNREPFSKNDYKKYMRFGRGYKTSLLSDSLGSVNPLQGAYFYNLIVERDFRGQGVGSMLIDGALDLASDMGVHSVFATCEDPGPAVGIFLRTGFRRIFSVHNPSSGKGYSELYFSPSEMK